MAQEEKSQQISVKKANQISDLYLKHGKSSQAALADRELWNNVKQQFDKIESTMADVMRRKEKLAKMQRLYDQSVAKKHSQLAEFEKLIAKLDKNLSIKDEFSNKSISAGSQIVDVLKDDDKKFTKNELLMGRFRDFKVKIPNRIKDLLQAKKDIAKIEEITANLENCQTKANNDANDANTDSDEDSTLDID